MRAARHRQTISARTWLTAIIAVSTLLGQYLTIIYGGYGGVDGIVATLRTATISPTPPRRPASAAERLIHFAGGFGVYTASDVVSAAAMGITTVFLYGRAGSGTTHALEARGLSRIEGELWALLFRYECSRLAQSKRSWAACTGEHAIPTQQELLQDVTDYLQSVQHERHILGYWMLDDWPDPDPGSARALLQAITQLAHRITPGRPTICGFGAELAPGHAESFSPAILANYAPGACDMVALYVYSASVTDRTTPPSSFDWSMATVLPDVERALKARGWDPAKVPLIGVAQAWGGARADVPGLYEIVPRAEDIATQSASFCRQGAIGIVYYSWADSTVSNLQTPANNKSLAQGVTQGITACKGIWAHRP